MNVLFDNHDGTFACPYCGSDIVIAELKSHFRRHAGDNDVWFSDVVVWAFCEPVEVQEDFLNALF